MATAKNLDFGQCDRQRKLLHLLLHRVTLQPDSIRIEIKLSGLSDLVLGDHRNGATHAEGLIPMTLPVVLKRRGVEAKLVVRAARGDAAMPDRDLIALLAEAHRWFDELVSGRASSVRAIALREGIDPGDLGRTIQLVFLAPDIIKSILAGRQPVELTPRRLKRIGTLPLEWDRQRHLFGFSA